MGIKARLTASYEAFASSVDGFGRMALWALLSLPLLGVIAGFLNPAKFGSYLWIVSKLSLAAVLGYGFDRAASPDARPSQLDGIADLSGQLRTGSDQSAHLAAQRPRLVPLDHLGRADDGGWKWA